MTTAINHWALHHPGGKLKAAKMLACCAFTEADTLTRIARMSWVFLASTGKLWDVAVTVFCIYNKVQVSLLCPDDLTGEWGANRRHSERAPLSTATGGPGGVLWGRRRGGDVRLYTPNAD